MALKHGWLGRQEMKLNTFEKKILRHARTVTHKPGNKEYDIMRKSKSHVLRGKSWKEN